MLGALRIHLGVSLQIFFEALSHILTLRNDTDTSREVFQDLRHEQRIMGAAKDDSVDSGIKTHNLVDAFLDEIVGTRRIGFIILHQGHPERTCNTSDLYVGIEFLDFEGLALALDGSLGGEYSHMTALGETADDLCRRTDDAQNSTVGIDLRDIVLLDGAQGLGRSCIATKDNEMATHLEELDDCLACELIDHIETAWAVGGTGIVAQIEVIVLGKQLTDTVQDGQSAIAAVENADRTRKR